MEKKKRFIISAVYYCLIGAIIFLLLKYAVFLVMPFIIGFAAAALLNPLVRSLCSKFGMKRRPAALFILLIFYAALGSIFSVIIVRFAVWIGDFSKKLPELYENNFEPVLTDFFDRTRELLSDFAGSSDSLTVGVSGLFDYAKSSIGSMVSDFSVRAIGVISSFAASIPKFMVGLLFAVISSFFFIIDYEKLIIMAKSRLPSKTIGILIKLREHFFSAISKYLRSYALIMLFTFSELFFGLALIGIKKPLIPAIIIAFLDMLPVIGTGVILLPWAIVELIGGNMRIGVGLILLWLIILIVRNIIEPKIVGSQVGLNPLATLISMFVGARLLGFFGLILAPLFLSVGVSAYREKKQLENQR